MRQPIQSMFSKASTVCKPLLRRTVSLWMACCILLLSCGVASANDYPVLSPWAVEEAYKADEAGILPMEFLHSDMRIDADRYQAIWFLVPVTEAILQEELPNTAAGTFPDFKARNSRIEAEKLYSAGIVTGYSDGNFHGEYYVTREEYAAMLYRMFLYLEQKTGVSLLPDPVQKTTFTDEIYISDWAFDAIQALSALNIFCGNANGSFSPQGNITIEQLIVLSYRCWNYCTEHGLAAE